jgi:hypothetical protein
VKDRQALVEEQERLLEVYDEVRQELLAIPGVVDVGVGIKEVDGGLTQQIAFRVYVEAKQPESALEADEIVPKSIRGFPTDVLEKVVPVPDLGFDDGDDWKNYSNKVGGSRIGNNVDGGGTGTLGCFARLADSTVVFFSNEHVMLSGHSKKGVQMAAPAVAALNIKLGQPDHDESCCCTCNEIAEVIDADANLDVAIAKLKSGVAFYPKIRKIKKSDGTLELNGFIAGQGNALSGEEVWKVGAVSGLTRGNVAQVTPDVLVDPTAEFTTWRMSGDSGSAIVSLVSGNVVGIHRAHPANSQTRGIGTRMQAIITRFNTTVIATDETLEYEDAELSLEDLVPVGSPFAATADRLAGSPAGAFATQIFNSHRRECLGLVNRKRPVTVAWHRSKGPSYLAALARSAKEPAYRIPYELQGITREQAAASMLAALRAHGSEALRGDLDRYAEALTDIFVGNDTVEEMIDAWERFRVILSPVPAG